MKITKISMFDEDRYQGESDIEYAERLGKSLKYWENILDRDMKKMHMLQGEVLALKQKISTF